MAVNFAIAQVSPVTSLLPQRGGPTAASISTPPDTRATINAGPPAINPSEHVDPALNLVVLQFFDAQGDLEQSIPSQKQLDAYRQDAGQATSAGSSRIS